MSKIYCFSAKNRRCHHDDYFLLISKFRNVANIKSFKTKIKLLLSNKPIIFLDIDNKDLLLLPFMIIRALWGGKAIAISVKTEFLYLNKNPEIISDKLFPLKQLFKRIFFIIIKYATFTKVYSIHKNTKHDTLVKRFTHDTIYDIQLWDLEFLDFKKEIPQELHDLNIDLKKCILFIGSVDKRTSRDEFIDYVNSNDNLNFIVAGSMSNEDYLFFKTKPNIIVIKRFLKNEELLFLMSSCDNIYAYYHNYRPSGFFGRALQLNKRIIIKNHSYLSDNFKEYTNLYSVSSLNDLKIEKLNEPLVLNKINHFNDSEKFSQIISTL